MSKENPSIKELVKPLSDDFIVKQDATGGKLRNMFAGTSLEDILVIDSKDRCLGIIPINAIFNRFSETQPAKNIVKKVSLIRNDSDIVTAALKLVGNNVTILPIVNKVEKLEGFITDYDLANYFLQNTPVSDVLAEEIIEDAPFTLSDSDNLGRILQIYRDAKATEIPVLNHQELELIGSVSINAVCRDWSNQSTVIWLDDKKRDVKHFLDAAVVKEDAVTLKMEDKPTVESAFKLMKKTGSRVLFVVFQGKYRGLITLKGIIHAALEWTQEQAAPRVTLHVSDAPDDEIREFAMRKAQNILNRYIESLGNEAEVHIKFKKILNQSKKGMFTWECSARFIGKSDVFTTSSIEFGSQRAANLTLEKMDRILRDASEALKERNLASKRPMEMPEAEEELTPKPSATKVVDKKADEETIDEESLAAFRKDIPEKSSAKKSDKDKKKK